MIKHLNDECKKFKCCVCANYEHCLGRSGDYFVLAIKGVLNDRLDHPSKYSAGEKWLIREVLNDMERERNEKECMNINEVDVNGIKEIHFDNKTYVKSENVEEEKKIAYKQGLEDAWEIARKVALNHDDGGYMHDEVKSIFGERWYEVFKDLSIHEVKEKIEAYEAEQNKPKLGDVVIIKPVDDECRSFDGIYLGTNIDGHYILENDGGLPTFLLNRDAWTIEKTGKHFDIQSMLDEIG